MNDETIKLLLAKLTPEQIQRILSEVQTSTEGGGYNARINSPEKIIKELSENLNTDVDIIIKIMRRVDEIYGRKEANVIHDPLYEHMGGKQFL